jgi:DNA-binding CsgD family transcriptional regulator
MNLYTRYDIFLQLLLHEKDDNLWQAELSTPVLRKSFRLQDLISSTNLILRECNQNFAQRCGCISVHELIGQSINHFIFGDRVSDVTMQSDSQTGPFIVKFRTSHTATDKWYMNTVGLVADDLWIYGMLGRQYDISPQLRKTAERKELKNKLTVKEFEIFLSLAKGHTVKHIAWNTGSTEKAVYYHIENMQRKMKTQSIVGIIQKAYRLGFMDAG